MSPQHEIRMAAASTPFSRRSVLKAGLLGAGAALSTSLLAACSTGGGSSSGGKTTIRVWDWYTGQTAGMKKLIADFEESHKSITVEHRVIADPNSYLVALQAAVSGGNVPDIFAPGERALTYGKQGVSLDLKQSLGSSFLATNQEFTVDGKQYAVGYMAQTFGLFYNPDVLAKAGVDGEPETWDDLIEAAAKINATGVPTLAIGNNPTSNTGDFFFPLITQVTDDPTYFLKLDALSKGASWDSAPVRKAIELNEKIIAGKVFVANSTGVTSQQAERLFYTEGAAMLYSGSFEPQAFAQDAPASFVKKYKVMKFPAYATGKRHWNADQAGAAYSVSSQTKSKDATLEFIKYMYEPTRYSALMNGTMAMPSTKDAVDKITSPIIKQMAGWLDDGCPHIPFGAGTLAVGDPLSKIYSDPTLSSSQVSKEIQAAVLNAAGK
jgi:ABC-type glycerol-3-phosphate transport system substrate-binding protein